MGKFAKMVGDPRIGYIFNQCRKMGLWEPLEKSEAKMSFTLNGRILYFKNSKQYKLFRLLFDNVKKSGMDIGEFLDSMPNVVKINENKNILNMKKVIRLTENDINRMVKDSVNNFLNEARKKGDWINISDDDDFNNPHYHFERPLQRIHDIAAGVASETPGNNRFIRDIDIQAAKQILAITSKIGYRTTPSGAYF